MTKHKNNNKTERLTLASDSCRPSATGRCCLWNWGRHSALVVSPPLASDLLSSTAAMTNRPPLLPPRPSRLRTVTECQRTEMAGPLPTPPTPDPAGPPHSTPRRTWEEAERPPPPPPLRPNPKGEEEVTGERDRRPPPPQPPHTHTTQRRRRAPQRRRRLRNTHPPKENAGKQVSSV